MPADYERTWARLVAWRSTSVLRAAGMAIIWEHNHDAVFSVCAGAGNLARAANSNRSRRRTDRPASRTGHGCVAQHGSGEVLAAAPRLCCGDFQPPGAQCDPIRSPPEDRVVFHRLVWAV